jgi:hypothetical protein
MAWQDRLRALGEELISGKSTIDQYRARIEEVLAEAEREAAEREPARESRVHIPTSAALEAPSGEMTQIVGTREEETTPVPNGISEKLDN